MKDASTLCKTVADVYRESVEQALREVNTRIVAAVGSCAQEMASEKTGPHGLTRLTRCLAERIRRPA